jgi:hypothetical protein
MAIWKKGKMNCEKDMENTKKNKLKSEKIWEIQKKCRLNSEQIWKKGMSISGKIWTIW